ncbi:MAG: ribonuclease Z [Oscillospiraceae bacterium]|nr:ribonuclease Z [Oscillospiraceae bacterium]
MLDVCLLGTGGTMPLPGRWLTSLVLRCNGRSLLIDAGEGTQIAAREAGCSFKNLDTICITHLHADHTAGLPGLLLTMGNMDRTEPVTVIGPTGIRRVMEAVKVIAPELAFDVKVTELEEGSTRTISLGDWDITAFPLRHTVPCFGYQAVVPRKGKFDPKRAVEAGIPKQLWKRLQQGERVEGFTPDMVLGPARRGVKLVYATDTRPAKALYKAAADADLLICEGMYGEPDKLPKAKETCHMMFVEATKTGLGSGAKELWLTHFSPSLNHPEDYLGSAQAIFPHTSLGKSGRKTVLQFPED